MLNALAVSALGLLSERPMHPYEMYQLLIARSEDWLVKVRPGSLYHAIDRLHQDGNVRAVATERAGNRPERTTYEITDDGRAALQTWLRSTLRTPVNEYPRFPLAIGEAHNLPQDEVAVLLRERVATLRADDDYLGAAHQQIENKALPERYWLDLPFLRHQLAAEISWLETLIGRLETGTIPWTDDVAEPHAGHAPMSHAALHTTPISAHDHRPPSLRSPSESLVPPAQNHAVGHRFEGAL